MYHLNLSGHFVFFAFSLLDIMCVVERTNQACPELVLYEWAYYKWGARYSCISGIEYRAKIKGVCKHSTITDRPHWYLWTRWAGRSSHTEQLEMSPSLHMSLLQQQSRVFWQVRPAAWSLWIGSVLVCWGHTACSSSPSAVSPRCGSAPECFVSLRWALGSAALSGHRPLPRLDAGAWLDWDGSVCGKFTTVLQVTQTWFSFLAFAQHIWSIVLHGPTFPMSRGKG